MNETAARYHGKHVIIHTDGACIGNPGKGGWAAILQLMDGDKEERRDPLTGSVPNTTNNQMELKAAIEGLRKVTSGSPILVRSDSQYVVKGATEWLPSWKSKGWRTADKKPVKNRELWEELDTLAATRSVSWEWVRGHNGDTLNEEVDRLAYEAACLRG